MERIRTRQYRLNRALSAFEVSLPESSLRPSSGARGGYIGGWHMHWHLRREQSSRVAADKWKQIIH